MLPVLFQIGFIKIYTFGIFLVLAFFWGCFLLWRNIRLTSLKEEEVFDGVFLSLFGGLFISRLLYIIFNFNEFGFHPTRFIFINGYPGLSLIGLIVGGITTMIFFLKWKKIPILETLDYFAGPFFLALVFGELGSFFAGVEVGIKTGLPLGIHSMGFDGLRHPIGLYMAIPFFLAVFFSHRLLSRVRRDLHRKGIVFAFFAWYLSITMALFSTLTARQPGQGINRDLFIYLFLLLTFSFYFIYYFRSRLLVGMGKIKLFKSFHKNHDKKLG